MDYNDYEVREVLNHQLDLGVDILAQIELPFLLPYGRNNELRKFAGLPILLR